MSQDMAKALDALYKVMLKEYPDAASATIEFNVGSTVLYNITVTGGGLL